MIPNSYVKAEWRCTLPVSSDGYIGIGFNLGNEVIRIQISKEHARHLSESVADYLDQHASQSDISSGSPSADVSPAEQLNV